MTRLLSRIQAHAGGSEPLALLFDSSSDSAAGLADTFGMDVSEATRRETAREVYKITQARWRGRRTVTVYRGGRIRTEIVPVTTDRGVAERHAARGGGRVRSWRIRVAAILADLDAVSPGGYFVESELLVHRKDLT